MFNFKSIIAPSYLGIDIGTTSIKAVEIVEGERRPRLKNYGLLETHGHLERMNSAIQTSTLKITEQDTVELIKTLVGKMKISAKDVAASIPSFSAFTTLLEFPQMSDTEILKTMQYQVNQYIPLPLSEVTIDWLKVGQRQDEQGFIKDQIILISVPNETIQKYRNIFKACGLNLKFIEVETLSLIRALSEDKAPTLFVDIGARSTNIIAAEGGSLKYSYQTDFSGTHLTQALASGLNINTRRAEKLKKAKGLSGGDESELSTLMTPYLDAIITEVKRAKNKYEQSFGNKIEKIVLSGGASKLSGIDKYFESQFNFPVVIGNPFSSLEYPVNLEPIVRDLGTTFSVAIGVALKGF